MFPEVPCDSLGFQQLLRFNGGAMLEFSPFVEDFADDFRLVLPAGAVLGFEVAPCQAGDFPPEVFEVGAHCSPVSGPPGEGLRHVSVFLPVVLLLRSKASHEDKDRGGAEIE